MFCQPRFSRKMEIWPCSLIQALRLSLTSWVFPEISSNIFFPLTVLWQCPREGLLRQLTDMVGSGETETMLEHGAQSFCSFQQASVLAEGLVKRHCWAQLLALLPGIISVTKAEYPKSPASVNGFSGSRRPDQASNTSDTGEWVVVLLAAVAPRHCTARMHPNSSPKVKGSDTLHSPPGMEQHKHLLRLRPNGKKEVKRELNKEKKEDGESSRGWDGAGSPFQATGSQLARKTALPWKVTETHKQELCFNGFWASHWLSAEGELLPWLSDHWENSVFHTAILGMQSQL